MRPTRRAKGDGDALRERLLDATESLLAEHGDQRAVTVRAIVERVGVTPPSLYLHFHSKEELVAAAVARRFTALGAAIEEATAGPAASGDAAGALRVGCLTYLRWAAEDPGGYAVLFGTHRDVGPPPGAQGRPDAGAVAFGTLVEGIAACQRTGQCGDGGDPRQMAALVWAALHGIATLTALGQGSDWPAVEWMVDRLLHGVVGTPPPARGASSSAT